jgi:hypothetical protein
MKKYVLGLCLLTSSIISFCQDAPEFDLITNKITAEEKIRTDYLERYTKCIVNIEAGNESGQGLLVGPNLVLTSYSLVAGKSGLSYKDVSGRTKYFDGYIAADPARGIILLKTSDVYTQFHGLSITAYNSFFPQWQKNMFLLHKEGNKYTVDRASLADRELPKADSRILGYIPRKVNYAGVKPVQGYIVFDPSMMMAGIIVYINGEPFHINNRPLLELSLYKDLSPINLSDLPLYTVPTDTKGKEKPVIYKIGLLDEKKTTNGKKIYDALSLDYIKREQQALSCYFTFKSLGWTGGINFSPNLRLIDQQTGMIYHQSTTETPYYVYNSTSYRKVIRFENIPASVNHIKLFNLPADVYEYEKALRYKTDPSVRRFFDDVIINNFPTTKKTDYDLEEDFSNEGTVAFYGLSSSNFKEAVRILIDGKQVGELTRFYTDENKTDFCGLSSSVTVKLKVGEYKYKAIMGKQTIERKFMITKGKCSGQLIKF